MRRKFGASAVGLAITGLLVAAPLSNGAGLLGNGGLNIGGRSGAVSGAASPPSGLAGTLGAVTSTVTGGGSGSGSGSSLSGTLGAVTGGVTGLTGGGSGSGAGSGLSGVTGTLGAVTGGLTSSGGLLGTVQAALGSALSATGLTGLTGLVRAGTPVAGSYTPSLHDLGNPHGEGTVATAELGANLLPGGANGGEVVVGRSLGEYQTSAKQFHGHITILSLFGTEIFGVDSTPGQTNTGILGSGSSAIQNLCTGTGGTICLNVLEATSTTTNVSSINSFEATGVSIPGVLTAKSSPRTATSRSTRPPAARPPSVTPTRPTSPWAPPSRWPTRSTPSRARRPATTRRRTSRRAASRRSSTCSTPRSAFRSSRRPDARPAG